MEFEVDIDSNEVEEYDVLNSIVGDRLYMAILLILLKNEIFNEQHAISTSDIYRIVRREFDKNARYLQIWKRLYRLLEYGVVERVGDNPVKWYLKKENIGRVTNIISKQQFLNTNTKK